MKSLYIYLVLICTVVFVSCNKTAPTAERMNAKKLPGSWELRGVLGGMLAYDPTDYSPGNGNLWTFTETDFVRILKDSVYRSGTYSVSLGTGTDWNTGRKINQLVLNNEPAESFELRNDTLRFYAGAIPWDGAIEMFVKIAENP